MDCEQDLLWDKYPSRSVIRYSSVYFTLRKINCLSACGGTMTLFHWISLNLFVVKLGFGSLCPQNKNWLGSKNYKVFWFLHLSIWPRVTSSESIDSKNTGPETHPTLLNYLSSVHTQNCILAFFFWCVQWNEWLSSPKKQHYWSFLRTPGCLCWGVKVEGKTWCQYTTKTVREEGEVDDWWKHELEAVLFLFPPDSKFSFLFTMKARSPKP